METNSVLCSLTALWKSSSIRWIILQTGLPPPGLRSAAPTRDTSCSTTAFTGFRPLRFIFLRSGVKARVVYSAAIGPRKTGFGSHGNHSIRSCPFHHNGVFARRRVRQGKAPAVAPFPRREFCRGLRDYGGGDSAAEQRG